MTTYFITGATGVVGNAVAEQVLRETDADLRLLIRAGSDVELQNRLEQLLRFWDIAPAEVADRVVALRGDTAAPRLGMAPEVYERVACECTHLVHCAAAVRMNLPLEEARRSAVTGAHNLIALARACEHKNVLQKVEFVSTVGVGGRLPGLLPERWIHEPRGFHNTYEQSKAEAEEIVAGHIEAGLPATVHRPSMVVGDSRTGKIMHFQIFYHLAEFLSGRRTCGLFPSLGQAKLDLVPVDYVARAIVWSSKHADTVGKVFHLCAGPRGALPLHVLRDRIRSRFASAGVRTPRTCTVPGGLFRTLIRVVGAMTTEGNRRALRTLPIFLDYLAEEQLFENADSIRVLATAGIELRPIDEVIDCVLGYYLAHRLVSG